MTSLPKISVNIPLITNGNASCVLKALKKVNYPKNLQEIIIVEGKSVGRQRNIAIKKSSGEILYLLDDDSRVQPNAFKILVKEFTDPKVAAVGGPSLTEISNGIYFNELIAYALETYFGAMRMRFRYSSQVGNRGSEYRLIGANLALRKAAVVKVGKFNEKIYPCDETELLRRLKKAGYKLRYNNKLFIYRNHRKNIYSLMKQFHYYGTGRMKQIMHSFNFGDPLFFIPIGFSFYLISLLFYHPIWYLIPLFLYILLAISTSFKAALKYNQLDLVISMSLIFPVIHISYAWGLIHGFFLKIINQDKKIKKKHKVRVKILTYGSRNNK
jgi:succinoglycan biosynthesis protein ExoA